MKKILFALAVMFLCGGYSFAATDVNETAGVAAVTTFDVTTSAAVDMSSSTLASNPFAYNLSNNSTTYTLYCGYSSLVSTSGNYMGFKVLPGTSQYRAVTYNVKIYCIASGGTISVTREIFGKFF